MNALQEELEYIHIFSDRNFQCAGKDDNHKNHVETEVKDLHYVLEVEEEERLSIKIHKTKKKKFKYTSRKKK